MRGRANDQILIDEELLASSGAVSAMCKSADPNFPRGSRPPPFFVSRTRHDLDVGDLKTGSLKEIDHVAAGEEAKVCLVEQSRGFIAPVSLQECADDAMVANVR